MIEIAPLDLYALSETRVLNILVIDDDVEATLIINHTFRHCDCTIDFAFTAEQGVRKINQEWYDLILLDWNLGQTTGGDLLKSVLENQTLAQKFRRYAIHGAQRIITYSATEVEKLALPESSYFVHFDHWQKPLDYKTISTQVSLVLAEFRTD